MALGCGEPKVAVVVVVRVDVVGAQIALNTCSSIPIRMGESLYLAHPYPRGVHDVPQRTCI